MLKIKKKKMMEIFNCSFYWVIKSIKHTHTHTHTCMHNHVYTQQQHSFFYGISAWVASAFFFFFNLECKLTDGRTPTNNEDSLIVCLLNFKDSAENLCHKRRVVDAQNYSSRV